MRTQHPDQNDMFEKAVYESRQAIQSLDMERFRLRIKTAMAAAIRDRNIERPALAKDMTKIMGAPVS